METSNLLDAEFKTLVIKIVNEPSEDLNSIKKDSVKNKGYTNWNKEQLQGNNSRVNEAQIQINDLEHTEEKNNQSEQQEEKKNQKKKWG